MFLIRGEYQDLLHSLFRREGDGRVFLGPALSRESLPDLDHLAEWTDFDDYIMEGGVSYSLRAREVLEGLVLSLRLKGTNRDIYVAQAVKKYIRWAGLEASAMDTS